MSWETRGDKGRQSKIISAQHPDMSWETRGDKGRQSKIISAQHPDMPWETGGDKGRQSKIISAQHPDTPWETRGGNGRQKAGIILAQHRFYARIENPSQQSCLGNNDALRSSCWQVAISLFAERSSSAKWTTWRRSSSISCWLCA